MRNVSMGMVTLECGFKEAVALVCTCSTASARCRPCALPVVSVEGAGAVVSSCRLYVLWHVCPSGSRMAATPAKEDTHTMRRRCSALAMMHLVT